MFVKDTSVLAGKGLQATSLGFREPPEGRGRWAGAGGWSLRCCGLSSCGFFSWRLCFLTPVALRTEPSSLCGAHGLLRPQAPPWEATALQGAWDPPEQQDMASASCDLRGGSLLSSEDRHEAAFQPCAPQKTENVIPRMPEPRHQWADPRAPRQCRAGL